MITREQFEAAVKQKAEADQLIQDYIRERDAAADARIESKVPFRDEELVYSAAALCPCGHGLAYPKQTGTLGRYWDCSAIWKGMADTKVKHTGQLPFMYYEIKEEGQPSAVGSTTRGVFKPKPTE